MQHLLLLSASLLPPCPEASSSGTRLPTSRQILPSAASVSTTIWETRKWPPRRPALASGYARTQGCLPFSSLRSSSPLGPCSSPASSPHRFLHVRPVVWPLRGGAAGGAATLRPALHRHLIASRFSAPAWLGWLPDEEGGGGTKLGSRGSQEWEASAEESLSLFSSVG